MKAATAGKDAWPEIPYKDWSETCTALHLWTQIIGQYRLSVTPWQNHSWHATLYVTPRGLTTGPVPDRSGSISVSLDFWDHACVIEAQGGQRALFPLGAMSIADFARQLKAATESVDGTFHIHGRPSEMENTTRFLDDTERRPYDKDAVVRYHAALISIERVFSRFRTGFIGKVSPVHLFWGSFDLAVTRFSGRPAPLHPGGVLNLPDSVTREAYSHEVSSAGFWPGSGVGEPMFYSYAYPTPGNFSKQRLQPAAASWNKKMGEFLLSYDIVRKSEDPEETLMSFLQSTYDAAANTGGWDRENLECSQGIPGIPRVVRVSGE